MRVFRNFSLTRFLDDSMVEKLRRLETPKENTWNLPWTFKGVPDESPDLRYIPDRMLIQNKIPITVVVNQFYKIFQEVVEAIGAMNLSSVQSQIESTLFSHLCEVIGQLKQEGKTLELVMDEKVVDRPTVNIIDAVVYRGLSQKREENGRIDEYHLYHDSDLGIICFTNLALTQPLAYTDQAYIERLHQINRQTILQCLVWIKSPYKIIIKKGDEVVTEYAENYNYAQKWMFESQCQQPKWMTNENKSESYMEWVTKFAPTEWILSDMNECLDLNFMFKSKKQA